MNPQSKNKNDVWYVLLAVTVIILIGYFIWFEYYNTPPATSTSVTTTTVTVPTDWLTYSDATTGISYKYPQTLGTNSMYIGTTTVDWPPQVQLVSGPFTCTSAGNASAPAGQTTQVTINGHTYCLTKETEGAAGSVYTQYAYATPVASSPTGQVAIFTFSIRTVQCANYDDPQKTECMIEQQNFNIDNTVDQMISSLTVNGK